MSDKELTRAEWMRALSGAGSRRIEPIASAPRPGGVSFALTTDNRVRVVVLDADGSGAFALLSPWEAHRAGERLRTLGLQAFVQGPESDTAGAAAMAAEVALDGHARDAPGATALAVESAEADARGPDGGQDEAKEPKGEDTSGEK